MKSSGTSLLDQRTLKTVVNNVVTDEDRSRSLIIFGLKEGADEQINEKGWSSYAGARGKP